MLRLYAPLPVGIYHLPYHVRDSRVASSSVVVPSDPLTVNIPLSRIGHHPYIAAFVYLTYSCMVTYTDKRVDFVADKPPHTPWLVTMHLTTPGHCSNGVGKRWIGLPAYRIAMYIPLVRKRTRVGYYRPQRVTASPLFTLVPVISLII